MDDIAIRVQNVSKSFRLPHERHNSLKSLFVRGFRRKRTFEKQHVLEDISFEIKKGEFFGIVGRNGSGKSTLLKLLAQIYAPDKGGIHVNGKLTPFIELGVGFNPELTGRENVFLNGALLGFNRTEMESMYDEIVEFAELKKFMDQKLKNYSSGMQVRLAFSIAIQAQSDILLLDEVLAVGDAAFQQKCYSYFEELRRNKQTVVFVSHDMEAVKRFCTEALLIENGKIKKIGKTEDIAGQYLLDNIQDNTTQRTSKKPKNKIVKSLSLKLISQQDVTREDTLQLKAYYCILEDFEPMLGISIMREGISVAEINSRAIKLRSTSNIIHSSDLEIDLNVFNPGAYSINISLFRSRDNRMLEYKLGEVKFVISGHDKTRGGATYIHGGWSQ